MTDTKNDDLCIRVDLREAVSDKDMFDGVYGCGMFYDWFTSIDADWDDITKPVSVTAWDPVYPVDGRITVSVDLSLDDLRRGLKIAIEKGYRHCGAAIDTDPDHWDSCSADTILQCAVYGDAVYG